MHTEKCHNTAALSHTSYPLTPHSPLYKLLPLIQIIHIHNTKSSMAMASLTLLSILLLFHGCLASQSSQNECQINRLETLEPAARIKSEAGVTEWWNPNHQQFQCAGVAVARDTVNPNGLNLPAFTNAPQLVYVVQGEGVQGTVFPGCPESYQESQQGEQEQGQRQRSLQDRHQKVRRLRRGDIIALPAGVVHWCYNDGNEDLVVVRLLDTSNNANQLDMNPRHFQLAGNPQEEQRKLRQMQREGSQEDRSRRGSRQEEEQQSSCNNIFCGFDPEILQEVFNIDRQLVEKLQNEEENRGTIIRVDRLQMVRPPRVREEEEEEEERERSRGRSHQGNGLEETVCAARIKENIGNPERADIFNPQAGRISTVNSLSLPILKYLRLSAERTSLYRNGAVVPHWCMNAHKILYMLKGSARIQIVNHRGNAVFNDEVREGQILTIPQNFAITERARQEGAEWVTFNTNDNAMSVPLAGRTSAMRGLPLEVIQNMFQISREQAFRLKMGNQETLLTSSSSSESERRPVA